MAHRNPHRWNPLDSLSVGGWIILIIAVVSTVVVASWPIHKEDGLELWTFARNHGELYQQLSVEYNRKALEDGREPVNVFVIDGAALSRRTLSGFWSGTPLADLIEVERNMMTQFVSGPIEDVGFTDLTDLIESLGLDETINKPSFAPWTSRGRIFGLPHDVHPVLLCYRADLVEAAGIDVNEIETWDDFVRVMSPLIADLDGDGRPDRYLLNLWYTNQSAIEGLLLQAGGGTFDENDDSLVASEANVDVVSHVVAWTLGQSRIAIDAPDFSASGNQLKLDGRVIAQVMPDWLAGIWKSDLPQLGGKVKLMPLPAWEPGGRRTSVMGGTMIGIPKSTDNFDAAWDVAQYLYVSRDLAQGIFESSNIISPIKTFWGEDFYHAPDPYFSGQPSGTAYIAEAPNVPFRSSNPFHVMALTRILMAATDLYSEAAAGDIVPLEEMSAEALMPRARELLAQAEARVEKEMSYNVFLSADKDEAKAEPDGKGTDDEGDAP